MPSELSPEERENILSEFKARHSPTAEDARRLGEWLDEQRAYRLVGHKPEHVEKRLQEALDAALTPEQQERQSLVARMPEARKQERRALKSRLFQYIYGANDDLRKLAERQIELFEEESKLLDRAGWPDYDKETT